MVTSGPPNQSRPYGRRAERRLVPPLNANVPATSSKGLSVRSTPARLLALALTLAASPSIAQTTQQDLLRRDPAMAWPAKLGPSTADVFNHNQLTMEQSCDTIYSWLSAPQDWPSWLIFARDVRLADPASPVGVGSRFAWTIFDIPIVTEVFVAEPGRRFGYTVTPPGPPAQYAQSWLLTAAGSGCKVTTEEVGVGDLARETRARGDLLVYLAHELWLASLRFVSRTGPRPPS